MELLLLAHIVFGSSLLASTLLGLFVETFRTRKLFAANVSTTLLSGLALLPSAGSLTAACVRLGVLSFAVVGLRYYSVSRTRATVSID